MTKTIMLVDDSATIRKIVELTFSDTEIRVESVGKDREVLSRIDSVEPDLVLADVTVPEPSGYELCRAIKASGRPVPVILLSDTFEPLDPQLARSCGADGQLIKPFESHALHETVSELLDRPADVSPFDDTQGEAFDGAADAAEHGLEAAEGDTDVVEGESDKAAGTLDAVHDATPSPELVDAVARAVVERLSADVVREIAREVVPDLAARIIRERIRELESEDV
jgi:DNA-binding response OmpR family regulator